MRLPRRTVAGLLTVALLLVAPSAAAAAPPDTSAIAVSAASVGQGETFTVTQEVYNSGDFTLVGGIPTLYGLNDLVDIVSCVGSSYACEPYANGLRAYVGSLAPGEVRTVVWTLRVRDDAEPATTQLQHQLDGENYAYPKLDGPALTITGTPRATDLAVAISASPRGILTSRIEYALTVTNHGPGDATGVRLAATYAAGLQYNGSASCVRVPDTRTVTCDVAKLPAGQSHTVRFATRTGLLALGPITTTVERAASTPADQNPGNDRARRTCSALTGLLVSC